MRRDEDVTEIRKYYVQSLADCDGFLFACHGAQQLFGALVGFIETHDPVRFAAGWIELMKSPRVNQVISE